jgi:superfamily II DNA or RNA helicase
MNIKLRDYQRQAVSNLEKFTKSNSKIAILPLPTGTGKTKTVAHFANSNPSLTIFFITPRINLTWQSSKDFKDPTVIQGSNYKKGSGNTTLLTSQLVDRELHLLSRADVIFVDEAHMNENAIKKFLKLNKPKIVAVTATPYKGDLSQFSWAKGAKHLIKPPYTDTRHYIIKGYLVDIDYLQIAKTPITKAEMKLSSNGDFTLNTQLKAVERGVDIIASTKDKLKGQTLVIATDIKHSISLFNDYKEAGFSVALLHSKQNRKEQLEALEGFKSGKYQILVSVTMVATGTDIPNIQTLVLARLIGSHALYRQIIGRVLRPAPNKTKGLILDCMGNFERLGDPLAPPQLRKATKKKKAICPHCETKGYRKILVSSEDEGDLIRKTYSYSCCGVEEEDINFKQLLQCEKCDNIEQEKPIKKGGFLVHTCTSCHHDNILEELEKKELVRVKTVPLNVIHETNLAIIALGYEVEDIATFTAFSSDTELSYLYDVVCDISAKYSLKSKHVVINRAREYRSSYTYLLDYLPPHDIREIMPHTAFKRAEELAIRGRLYYKLKNMKSKNKEINVKEIKKYLTYIEKRG